MKKLVTPVKPSWMDSVPPSRPDRIPRGMPKFRLQPDWIMGTMASTRMAFQLKRLITLPICIVRSAPTMGAMTNSSTTNAAMISRGIPNRSIKPRTVD